jgi:hypothetical protein
MNCLIVIRTNGFYVKLSLFNRLSYKLYVKKVALVYEGCTP